MIQQPSVSGSSLYRRWIAGWVGAALIGVANGAARDVSYGRRLSQAAAHQVSTGTLIGGVLAYMVWLDRRNPLLTGRSAVLIGTAWAVMTMLFEVGVSRARGLSWSQTAADYNLARGRLWPLVLVAMAAGPALVRWANRAR